MHSLKTWTQRRCRQGFAILLSMLLVLILTIFGYWMLLVAENHYAASKILFDSENARIISEASAARLVLQHNSIEPRFFIDPRNWQGLRLKPYEWNGYGISGTLSTAWSAENTNLLNLQVRKARSFANLELPLRQMRFEDFAFFSDAQQTISSSTLFDGDVFARGGIIADHPVRFRGAVHNDVSPASNASYKKTNRMWLEFPFPQEWNLGQTGLNITTQDPRFWQLDHYELNLDQLEILEKTQEWGISYKGIPIGRTSTLALLFDGSVHISQNFSKIQSFPSGKSPASLYIHSSEDVIITGSIQSLQGSRHEHPLCIYSVGQMRIQSDYNAIRIQACLIATGEPSLHVGAGSEPLSNDEKQAWIAEVQGSTFIVEPEMKAEFLRALHASQKIVWFRGSVGVKGSFFASPDIAQVHFESCRAIHNLIPSFPFVQIVEGRQKWL